MNKNKREKMEQKRKWEKTAENDCATVTSSRQLYANANPSTQKQSDNWPNSFTYLLNYFYR